MNHRAAKRQMMSTLHQNPSGGRILAVKGSPTEVLAHCRWRLVDGERRRLGETDRQQIAAANERLGNDALPGLGVGFAERAALDETTAQKRGLTWCGLVGLADAVRGGMAELMHSFHRAGIKTAMITGDQSATAYAVARKLDLANGNDIEILDSAQLDL